MDKDQNTPLAQSMLECIKATAKQESGTDVSKSKECQKFASELQKIGRYTEETKSPKDPEFSFAEKVSKSSFSQGR